MNDILSLSSVYFSFVINGLVEHDFYIIFTVGVTVLRGIDN